MKTDDKGGIYATVKEGYEEQKRMKEEQEAREKAREAREQQEKEAAMRERALKRAEILKQREAEKRNKWLVPASVTAGIVGVLSFLQ